MYCYRLQIKWDNKKNYPSDKIHLAQRIFSFVGVLTTFITASRTLSIDIPWSPTLILGTSKNRKETNLEDKEPAEQIFPPNSRTECCVCSRVVLMKPELRTHKALFHRISWLKQKN
jgi:hypothetical protein